MEDQNWPASCLAAVRDCDRYFEKWQKVRLRRFGQLVGRRREQLFDSPVKHLLTLVSLPWRRVAERPSLRTHTAQRRFPRGQ